jgi:hypothetical protein
MHLYFFIYCIFMLGLLEKGLWFDGEDVYKFTIGPQ